MRAARAAYYDDCVLPHDAAGRAARFFILHRPETDAALRAWLGAPAVDFLDAMGALAGPSDARRALTGATWFAGRLIFSDARAYNVLWPGEPFPDYVMPPGRDSLGLVRVAPRLPRRATLDLCCGPGTQTLAAADYSERVVGVDLNPRALRFARFNAAVNRIDNATFLCGDAYAPLDGARFDAIVSNPPFVPWPPDDAELLYRGGGARGDDVLARILAGAVDRLDPQGSLTVCADLADAAGLPARIRTWQGVERRTLILLQHRVELLEYAEVHAAHHDDGALRGAQAVRLLQHFHAAGIETLDFGYVVQDGTPGRVQVERTGAPASGALGDDVASWFAHQRRLDAGGVDDVEVRLAPGLRLVDVAEREAGGETATSCYVAPGAGSLHAPRPVPRAEFAQLIRAAAGGLRVRDVTERGLLERGLLRLRD